MSGGLLVSGAVVSCLARAGVVQVKQVWPSGQACLRSGGGSQGASGGFTKNTGLEPNTARLPHTSREEHRTTSQVLPWAVPAVTWAC